jgi:hypothetical protein
MMVNRSIHMNSTTPQPIHNQSYRSKFSAEEDEQLRALVPAFGRPDWHAIAENLPGRNARQCRERWGNYLSPMLNSASWTPEEDRFLLEKQAEFGTRWVQIAKCFPNRTDGMVKNRFNVLRRREAREEELQRSCDPLLMLMVLGVSSNAPSSSHASRKERTGTISEPGSPTVIESMPAIEAEFESWPEAFDYESLDF